jgi:hypothetical protein
MFYHVPMASVVNTILGWLDSALSFILSVLPDSPFEVLSTSPLADYLGFINWLFPFDFFVSSATTWLAAIAIYYLYTIILRWVKAIS